MQTKKKTKTGELWNKINYTSMHVINSGTTTGTIEEKSVLIWL